MPGEGGGETLIFVPCRAKSGVPINQMAIGEGGFLFSILLPNKIFC